MQQNDILAAKSPPPSPARCDWTDASSSSHVASGLEYSALVASGWLRSQPDAEPELTLTIRPTLSSCAHGHPHDPSCSACVLLGLAPHERLSLCCAHPRSTFSRFLNRDEEGMSAK